MNYFSTIFLLCSILIYGVFSIDNSYDFNYTNYTINDIENFKVNINDCQEYSNTKSSIEFRTRNNEIFNACDYKYLCHKNNKCIIIYKNDLFEGISSKKLDTIHINAYKNDNETLIALACNEKEKKINKCSTDKCNSDSDCYSNKCVDGNCITDESNPVYLCRTIKENDNLKVKCLLNYQEKCNEDNECADNAICNSNKICQIKEISNVSSTRKMRLLKILITIVLIFVLFIILYIILSRKSKKNF